MSELSNIDRNFIRKLNHELRTRYESKTEPVLEAISSLEDACENLRRQTIGTKGLVNKIMGTYNPVAVSLIECEQELERERLKLKEMQKQYPQEIVQCLYSVGQPYFNSNSSRME
ncbi:MAG: hypothetical protein ABIA37_02095 [Candidatus Woesearchaeota archaeon]